MSDTVPLPAAADAILAAIRTGQVPATVTNAELGRIAGCHQRTACRHLGTLARRGVIRIERVAPNPGGLGTLPTGRRVSAVPAPTSAASASPASC